MEGITKSEIAVASALVKSPETMYNANNLSKVLGITSMGTLKILKRLEKDGIVTATKIGKASIYKVNIANYHARNYIKFLLSKESANSIGFVKRWVSEIRKIKNADLAILFGSALEKESSKDIDVLLLTDQKRFGKLKKEVEEINKLNIKEVHPLYQTQKDLISNIKKKDKAVLNSIKGIVVFGEDKFLEVYNESCRE